MNKYKNYFLKVSKVLETWGWHRWAQVADKRMLGGRGTLEQEGREGFEQEVEGSILNLV